MAGFVSRLKSITASRIYAFLETVEDPEKMFPQLVREMQDRIADAVKAESKAAGALKAGQRRLDESTGRSLRLAKGAELALRHGDESLAREALSEQIRTDRICEDQRRALEQSEKALLEARESRMHLETQLAELQRRKKNILARSRSARKAAVTYRTSEKVRAAGSAILDEVSRMEQRIDTTEYVPENAGKTSAIAQGSLEDRLRTLEREVEIERRLDSIREKKRPIRTQSVPDGRTCK